MDTQDRLDRILRLPAVLDATGLSRSRLYDMMAKGRFPQSVRIGERSVGWRSSDVQDWIKTRALACEARQIRGAAKKILAGEV